MGYTLDLRVNQLVTQTKQSSLFIVSTHSCPDYQWKVLIVYSKHLCLDADHTIDRASASKQKAVFSGRYHKTKRC